MPSVYDDQKTRADDDELRQITGIDPDQEGAMEREAYSGAAEDMAERTGLGQATEDDSQGNSDTGSWKTNVGEDAENPGRMRRARRWTARHKKQLGIGGGVAGGGVAVVFGIFSIISGPAQFVQLAKTLGKFSGPMDNAISRRMDGLTRSGRALRTGEVGETRVSWLGSRKVAKIRASLAEKGITITPDPATNGQTVRLTIDATLDPELSGRSVAERRRIITERYSRYGVDGGSISIGNLEGTTFDVDASGLSNNRSRILINDTVSVVAGDSRIRGAMMRRQFGKFFNTTNPVLHPIKALESSIERRLTSRSVKIETWFSEKLSRFKPRLPARYSGAFASMKGKVSQHAGKVSGALAMQAGVCFVKEVADLIPLVNYAEVLVPAAIHATESQAVGSQIQAGKANMSELSMRVESFTDHEGKNLWSGKALNALADGTAGVGVDLDDTLKAAFYTTTTTAGILGAVDSAISWEVPFTNISLSSALCNDFAQYVGIGAGLVLTVIPGAGWGARFAASTASGLLIANVMNFAGKFIVDHEKAVLEADDYLGPAGGNLAAWGARASANIDGRSSGGVAISPGEEALVMNEINEQEKQEFRQRSLAERLFDAYDTRSMVASIVRSPFATPNGALANLSTLLAKPFSLFGSIGNLFSQRALAATNGYDWGDFPLYTMPKEILDDPAYADPIENGDIAAGILNGSDGNGLISRAKKCFGVKISKGAHGWEVTPESDVNPAEDEYQDAHCDDLSDSNWKRIVALVFDDIALVTPLDCYGDDEAGSCAKLGFNNSSQNTDQPTTNTGSSARYIPDCSANNGNAKIACVAIDTMLGIPYRNTYSKTNGCVQQPSASNTPNPVPALDCSAFTSMAVYRAFGTNAPRSSVAYLTDPNFEVIGDTRNGEKGDIRDIKPGDLVGKGVCASSGQGCNGHIGIVVSYNRTTGELITVETDTCSKPSRVETTKSLAIDGKGGNYTWAVRYTGTQGSPGGTN